MQYHKVHLIFLQNIIIDFIDRTNIFLKKRMSTFLKRSCRCVAIIRECDKIDVGVRERGGKRSVEEMRYKKSSPRSDGALGTVTTCYLRTEGHP